MTVVGVAMGLARKMGGQWRACVCASQHSPGQASNRCRWRVSALWVLCFAPISLSSFLLSFFPSFLLSFVVVLLRFCFHRQLGTFVNPMKTSTLSGEKFVKSQPSSPIRRSPPLRYNHHSNPRAPVPPCPCVLTCCGGGEAASPFSAPDTPGNFEASG